jgi:hypothetical protein
MRNGHGTFWQVDGGAADIRPMTSVDAGAEAVLALANNSLRSSGLGACTDAGVSLFETGRTPNTVSLENTVQQNQSPPVVDLSCRSVARRSRCERPDNQPEKGSQRPDNVLVACLLQ